MKKYANVQKTYWINIDEYFSKSCFQQVSKLRYLMSVNKISDLILMSNQSCDSKD
jgi:hypothetical protein